MKLQSKIRDVAFNPYVITTISSAAAAFGNVLAYKFAATLGTGEQFYNYSSARRLISFALPVISLGFGVTFPVFIARKGTLPDAIRLLYRQLAIATVLALLFAVTVWIVPPWVSERFANGLTRLEITAVAIASVSLNCTAMLYAYFRGRQEFRKGALVAVVANGVAPVIAILTLPYGVTLPLLAWAFFNFGISAVVIFRLPRHPRGRVSEVGAFIRACIGRVPGDVSYGLLFLLPVILVYGSAGTVKLSVFNFFFVVMGIFVSAVAPLSIVLLPKIASLVGADGVRAGLRPLAALTATGVVVGLAAMVLLNSLPELIVSVFLSPTFVDGAEVLEQLAPSMFGLVLFVFLKSVVDGLGITPHTANTSMFALVGFGVVYFLTSDRGFGSVVLAVNSAFLILGLTTAAVGFGVVAGVRRKR